MTPAVSRELVAVKETPCNGTRSSPCNTAAFAALAMSRASCDRVTMAFSAGLAASMRFKCTCTTSTGEMSRDRISSASLLASV